MAPGEDVERGRASSAAERQKSIVSMTEFEGMDEYTALQKYILFYRDPRAAGHSVEEAPKKKKWWQSGGGKATGGADLAAEVPDDCKYILIHLHRIPINWVIFTAAERAPLILVPLIIITTLAAICRLSTSFELISQPLWGVGHVRTYWLSH
jgi:hypothetical protein